jgi:hypothetical protein
MTLCYEKLTMQRANRFRLEMMLSMAESGGGDDGQ